MEAKLFNHLAVQTNLIPYTASHLLASIVYAYLSFSVSEINYGTHLVHYLTK